MNDADERYWALCELIAEFDEHRAREVLEAFDADTDLIDETMERWHVEHVTNLTGRVEGTIEPVGDEFVAIARCGPAHGTVRRFGDYQLARYWLLNQDKPDPVLPAGVPADAEIGGPA